VTIPREAGSAGLRSGETLSWRSIDVGVAAYSQKVDDVRLLFAGGGSEVLKARALSRGLALKNAEKFRYVVFAVEGCVREVQGLVGGRVVAQEHSEECVGPPE